LARSVGQVLKEFGQTAALVVGVRAAVLRGTVIELRQHAFVVVPHQQQRALLEELDGSPALFGGGTLMELGPFAVFAKHREDALGRYKLLKADKAGAVAEQPAARPPQG